MDFRFEAGSLVGLRRGRSSGMTVVWPYLVRRVKEIVPRLLMAWPTLLHPTHPSSPYKSSSPS